MALVGLMRRLTFSAFRSLRIVPLAILLIAATIAESSSWAGALEAPAMHGQGIEMRAKHINKNKVFTVPPTTFSVDGGHMLRTLVKKP